MSTKIKRPRGRPRKFDEAAVLEAAAHVFWEKGFSGTSIDDLAAAMGMNRPSIYGAFGDKEAIYRRTLERFCDSMQEAMAKSLFAEPEIRKALVAFYRAALTVYLGGPKPLGCMVMSTAVCAAPSHPDVQSDLKLVLETIDDSFRSRFDAAIDAGQLPPDIDSTMRARIAQGVLHSLSVRARAGESRKRLNALIESSVDLLVGA